MRRSNRRGDTIHLSAQRRRVSSPSYARNLSFQRAPRRRARKNKSSPLRRRATTPRGTAPQILPSSLQRVPRRQAWRRKSSLRSASAPPSPLTQRISPRSAAATADGRRKSSYFSVRRVKRRGGESHLSLVAPPHLAALPCRAAVVPITISACAAPAGAVTKVISPRRAAPRRAVPRLRTSAAAAPSHLRRNCTCHTARPPASHCTSTLSRVRFHAAAAPYRPRQPPRHLRHKRISAAALGHDSRCA